MKSYGGQRFTAIKVPHYRHGEALTEQKIQIRPEDPDDFMKITPLGSGQEVGRSCLVIQYKGKTVMLDCGLHPALHYVDSMPYLDEVDLEKVDLLLVTHFHLDHAACLPYFLTKTSFKSKCFMTHPTKSIYKLIIQDFVKVSTYSSGEVLYGEKELIESMASIDTVDYHSDKIVNGIRFRAYHAGHVLGAAMFMIEIANVKILYTGDYSCDDDRHLKGAEIPNEKPDILIIESTFGTQSLRPVRDREKEFTGLVHMIVKRGGRCLIPVFALGRAQELLLIMEEYWSNNKSLQHIPIYYASALAKKCLQVYQTYINMMNPRIQQQYKVSNPFQFQHVHNLRSRHDFQDFGPSVVFASPGMLQNGLSRTLFERWCTERKNGLVIPGYAVEGTLAKIVQSEPSEVDGMNGAKLPLKMTVHYVMFAAHADHDQTKRFITELKPPNVILVHGERKAMTRVKQSLQRSFGDYGIRISDPANCQSVEIEFRKDRICKVVGGLVDEMDHNVNRNRYNKTTSNVVDYDEEESGMTKGVEPNFDGLLVRKDFNYQIMAPRDLSTFTPMKTTQIEQSLMIPFNQSFTALSLFISRIYDIEYVNDPKDASKSKKIVVRVVDDYNVPSSVTHSKRLRDAKKLKAIKAIKSKSVSNSTKTPAVDDGDDEEEDDEEEEEDEDIDIVLDDNHHRRAIPKPVANQSDDHKKEDEDGDEEMYGDLDVDLESKYNAEDIDLSVTLEKAVDLADKKMVKMTWKSSPISDMIADSIIGLALTLEVDPSTAIAEVMMQPVDHDELNQNRQSQPHPLSSNLSSMMSSKEAFAFILCEQFGNENVQCIEENMPFRDTVQGDGVETQMAADQMMALWNHKDVVRYCFVVHYEGSMATISFKYNYKRRYDTKLHHESFWSAKKERLESNLSKRNNAKIQKKLSHFESMLERIAENEEEYFDQQFIPCFEVQSEDPVLKQRIESILHCVDNALYPITCDFDCIDSFESVFDHGHSIEGEQKAKAIEAPQTNTNGDERKEDLKEGADDLMKGVGGNGDDEKVNGNKDQNDQQMTDHEQQEQNGDGMVSNTHQMAKGTEVIAGDEDEGNMIDID